MTEETIKKLDQFRKELDSVHKFLNMIKYNGDHSSIGSSLLSIFQNNPEIKDKVLQIIKDEELRINESIKLL